MEISKSKLAAMLICGTMCGIILGTLGSAYILHSWQEKEASFFLLLAVERRDEGDLWSATALSCQAMAFRPNWHTPHLLLAEIFQSENDFEREQKELELALERFDNVSDSTERQIIDRDKASVESRLIELRGRSGVNSGDLPFANNSL